MAIILDYSFMVAPPVNGAIPEAELVAAQDAFERALERFNRRRASGDLGFLDLPGNAELLESCESVAKAHEGRVDDVVVLGIGGSALGAVALRTALLPYGWNQLGDARRGGRPRLHVLDNVDPRGVLGVLDSVRPERTLFLVISKSGSTAETMAQFLVVRQRLAESGVGSARERMVFITDPRNGMLRALARDEGITALSVPANVGGRYSALSPVGILPALLTGVDARKLLHGAGAMSARCSTPILHENPAGLYAVLQWLAHTRLGRGTHVFMPYSDALRDFAAWFVQLWAESLGKENGSGEHVGPTPLPAVGATDQHSQVQLFMEGPHDKTVTFLTLHERETDCAIPYAPAGAEELSYLGGHTLGELLDLERRATAGALAVRGRPSMTIELPAADARHVGELIMLLQIATVLAGELYGVNPLNQPGVELGKQFTYALMGKPGSERALREWEAIPRVDPWRRV